MVEESYIIIKAIFNLLIILIIVRYIYYPVTKNKDYLFTYLLISLTVFLLCVLLDSVKLQLGFALGLFAGWYTGISEEIINETEFTYGEVIYPMDTTYEDTCAYEYINLDYD